MDTTKRQTEAKRAAAKQAAIERVLDDAMRRGYPVLGNSFAVLLPNSAYSLEFEVLNATPRRISWRHRILVGDPKRQNTFVAEAQWTARTEAPQVLWPVVKAYQRILAR